MVKMKSIKLFPVLLLAMALAACSPRVAQPPPLEELEPPDAESTFSGDLGPQVFDDMQGSGADGLGGFEGDQKLSDLRNLDWRTDPNLETVYFDYDRYDLSGEAQTLLLKNAEYLRNNPRLRVQVEGHCDERGTDAYNEALGENRALAVREYLIQLGIEANRINPMSYGELMPSVEGNNESAWRWNRRAEFKVAN
jgi:peptidoglycan-associated lipoprotein